MEIYQKFRNYDLNNENSIHFWQFPPEIMINLETNFKREFFGKVVSYFGRSFDAGIFINHKSKEYTLGGKYNGSNIRAYKSPSRKYVPQWVIKELALKIGYNLYEIENSIISYRARHGSSIVNPILPVKVTPEFDSILSHIMCDGTEKRTKNKAASYAQKSIKGRENFYKKLINIFGEINPPSFNDERKGEDVGIPKAILLIIKHHYSIKNIGTFESYLPKQILLKPKEHKLAILTTFLVDEGSIYDMISLRMKNLGLIESLRYITLSLGYKCSKVNKFVEWTGGYVYGFNISNLSLKQIKEDIEWLSKIYPTCNLVHKQQDFDVLANQKRTSERTRYFGETKQLILNFLKREPKTTMELAKLTNVCRRTIRIHVEDLKNLNKLELAYVKSKGAKVWKLKN